MHALSAAALARRARELEGGETVGPSVGLRGCAAAAVALSAFFLEASANEFFLDLVEKSNLGPWLAVLPADRVEMAVRLWDTADLDRLGVLEKFNTALEVFGNPPLDLGRQPAQGAALLVAVRNALVHPKPVTNSDRPELTTDVARKLSARLEAAKVARCRLTGRGNAMFPDGLLGAGGASWAFAAALNCADEFYGRLGIPPRYEHLRPQLELETRDAS